MNRKDERVKDFKLEHENLEGMVSKLDRKVLSKRNKHSFKEASYSKVPEVISLQLSGFPI